ncbi:MAG: carbamate kinase [Simkaniaceae bacterium]|nr:MAG: carbamate kinase [Simkaniaceae bacterium]
MKKKEIVLVALGGNALQQSGEKGTIDEQLAHVRETADHLIEILEGGYSLLITHGNGPQVGSILLKNERSEDQLPPMPLDVCGAETQGMIGYMIQQQLRNHLQAKGRKDRVVTLCTQTLVDHKDPAFQTPTKPIGLFYTKEKAEALQKEKGWHIVEQIGKGFRRVVPSPMPVDIVEGELIEELLNQDVIVVACGGGGIPVIQEGNGNLKGVEAVIDKDQTAAVLGEKVGAEILLILTDVEQVALNFGQAKQKNLDHLTVEEARAYLKQGEFGAGSMGPKVEAACSFIESGGKKALITSLAKACDALKGTTGTLISK